MALAHSDSWIQRQGLKLLYLKGMIQDPSLTDDALDLLRQVRESSNEDLRELAFRLSLFAEEGVQQYLRSLDEILHNQLNDLESDRLSFAKDQFTIDATVEQLFLDAVPKMIEKTQRLICQRHKPLCQACRPYWRPQRKPVNKNGTIN